MASGCEKCFIQCFLKVPCLLGQHDSCSTAQQPVELSENILPIIFHNLTTQNVLIHQFYVLSDCALSGLHCISNSKYSKLFKAKEVYIPFQVISCLRGDDAASHPRLSNFPDPERIQGGYENKEERRICICPRARVLPSLIARGRKKIWFLLNV